MWMNFKDNSALNAELLKFQCTLLKTSTKYFYRSSNIYSNISVKIMLLNIDSKKVCYIDNEEHSSIKVCFISW